MNKIISDNEKQEREQLLSNGRDGRFKAIIRNQFGINGIAFTTNLTIIFLLLIVFILCMITSLSVMYTNNVKKLNQNITKEDVFVLSNDSTI